MASKTFKTMIIREGSICYIPLTFDPKHVFGKVRAPVKVTLNDLVRALRAASGAWDRWRRLSYTHQREHVEAIEESKRPETRARRVARAVRLIRGAPAK